MRFYGRHARDDDDGYNGYYGGGGDCDDGCDCGDDFNVNSIFEGFDFLFGKSYRDFIIKYFNLNLKYFNLMDEKIDCSHSKMIILV